MKDQDLSAVQALAGKTKEQLIDELLETYRRIAELETAEAERKHMETKLRESEEKYRCLTENALDGISVYRDSILFVNDKLCELLGYTKEELYGMEVAALLVPEDRERVRRYITDRLAGREAPTHYETKIICRDGSIRHIEVAATRIIYKGQPAGQAVLRDITERKWAEEELKRHCEHLEDLVKERTATLTATNEQLQQEITERKHCFQNLTSAFEKLKRANEELDHCQEKLRSTQEKNIQTEKLGMFYKFAAFIVHDLTNLAASLSLAVRTLQTKVEKAHSVKPQIDNITTNIEKMRALIAKFSSLPDGLELKFKRRDIVSLIRDVLGKFKPRNIKISEHLPHLPPIDCDDSLQVAFYNIIKNSIEAMPFGGELSISASLTKKEREIKIRIADTGYGIPEDSLKDLFKPFQTTKKRGLGIGLYQCKEIIERHKGEITLKSKLNQGTECFIVLPIVQNAG